MLFGVLPALAIDLPLMFDGDARATEYRMEYSEDLGATWVRSPVVIPQPSPFPPSKEVFTVISIPDTGLILIRAVAVNAAGEHINSHKGAWYNALWSPISVRGLGIE